MKKILLAFMMCTMVLCTSSVSFGADVGNTTNSDEIINVDFEASSDIVTITNLSFSTDFSYEINNNYTSDAILFTPLAITTNYVITKIEHCFIYLNNYDSHLATTPEPDQSVGILPSNHVGKLFANISILTMESLIERKTTNVGKPITLRNPITRLE